jgi:thiosulfate/3-mercaptopyruvate sulfurtransferase
MTYQTLISAAELQALLARQEPLVLLDCGFDLADTQAGQRAYAAGHLPGARYAHLDRDLSGAKTGANGRHPLPARADLARTLAQWGVAPGVQVVTYDDQAMPYAARAWWLLRWMGHTAVAVLDGGRAAWARMGGPLATDLPPPSDAAPYPAAATPGMPTIDAAALLARLGQAPLQLLDARAAERFRGEVEPLDPVAGHIPGATQRFFKDNLGSDGCFKPAAQLRAEFAALLPPTAAAPDSDVIHQCGSGVTACHNLLAMSHAGWEPTVLYPGSWSEWCSDTGRPMVKAGAHGR